jgi:hypothetical protein
LGGKIFLFVYLLYQYQTLLIQMNTPDTYFTQKDRDELFPYLVTLNPKVSIEKVEKISLQELNDSDNTGVIPPHVRNDLIRDMAYSSSTDSLQRLGVVRLTMEDGKQYYLQEGNNIGSDSKITMVVDMNTPLPDISVFRGRMYDNAITLHKNEVKARNKTGGTPGGTLGTDIAPSVNKQTLSQSELDARFFNYVKGGDVEKTLNMLLPKPKVDVNMVDPNGDTPLMIASKHGHHKIVMFLLKNGAEINMENHQGWTPISYPDKNTRAYRHTTTAPGIGGRKKKTRKNNKKPKKHNRKTKNKRKSRRKRTRLGRKK